MKRRSSISKATTAAAIGEYWDTHDVAEVWDRTTPVDVRVEIDAEKFYCRVDSELAETVHALARKRGIPTDTLINLLIQEKLMAKQA